MKKYQFNISGTLTFTHQNKDYAINGKGPHQLPAENQLVKSLEAQGILTLVEEEIKVVKNLKK